VAINFIRALVEAFNPCIHQWRVETTLQDRPEDPREVLIIRSCDICGAVDQQTVKAPHPPDPPPDTCPPHKWKTVQTIRVVADIEAKIRDTKGYKYIQECERCGEMRTIFQGSDVSKNNKEMH
jgi:ribosomal protein S14